MSENSEFTNADANQVTLEQITDVIAELEQYRERLLNDTLTNAQKAKISKAKTMAQLEPQLAQIDEKLEQLRHQQASLSATN